MTFEVPYSLVPAGDEFHVTIYGSVVKKESLRPDGMSVSRSVLGMIRMGYAFEVDETDSLWTMNVSNLPSEKSKLIDTYPNISLRSTGATQGYDWRLRSPSANTQIYVIIFPGDS